MRRNSSLLPFVFIGLTLVFLLSVPQKSSDTLRSFSVASLSPFFQIGLRVNEYLLDRPIGTKFSTTSTFKEQMELENRKLRAQIEPLFDWIYSEKRLLKGAEFWKEMNLDPAVSIFKKNHFKKLLEDEFVSMGARVIYRDPSSWSSSLWINVGEEDNLRWGKRIVEKNSPVLSGGSLVGVIDHVGKRQSRVRLITDSGLAPAVRASRGKLQNRHLSLELESVKELMSQREDLFTSEDEKIQFISALNEFLERLKSEKEDLYLAKGELHGSSAPLWRSQHTSLKGIGFNFNFPDLEGPLASKKKEDVPILKEGDLLITSGLDGVFPAGLLVATVQSIGDLKEGGYAYEIVAKPTALDLNRLKLVFVMPALRNE